MSKNLSSPFIPFPITLYNFFMLFNDVEKSVLLYLLKHFHYNNFAKSKDTFKLSEIAEATGKSSRYIPGALSQLAKFEIIKMSKDKNLVIEFNKSFLTKDFIPFVTEENQNESDKMSHDKMSHDKTSHDKMSYSTLQNVMSDVTNCHIESDKMSYSTLQNVMSDTPETIVKSSVPESPNNYINNIYNNNNNNSINKEKSPEQNQQSEPDLFDRLFIKKMTSEEKRSQEAKAIFKKLKAINFMAMPDRSEEYIDGLINKKISEFENLEMIRQMIESALRDTSLITNEEKNRRIGYYFKNPDKFTYTANLESEDTFQKEQERQAYLMPIKKVFKLTGKPEVILTEFINRIIPLCSNFSKGYIKASDDLVKSTFKARQEFFDKIGKEFLVEDKNFLRETIEKEFETERIKFELISYTMRKSYSVADLKKLINYALYSNKHRKAIATFIEGDIDRAMLRILKPVAAAADNFRSDNYQEPEPSDKVLQFSEIKKKPTVQDIAELIPYSGNNLELVDYVAKNLNA